MATYVGKCWSTQQRALQRVLHYMYAQLARHHSLVLCILGMQPLSCCPAMPAVVELVLPAWVELVLQTCVLCETCVVFRSCVTNLAM